MVLLKTMGLAQVPVLERVPLALALPPVTAPAPARSLDLALALSRKEKAVSPPYLLR